MPVAWEALVHSANHSRAKCPSVKHLLRQYRKLSYWLSEIRAQGNSKNRIYYQTTKEKASMRRILQCTRRGLKFGKMYNKKGRALLVLQTHAAWFGFSWKGLFIWRYILRHKSVASRVRGPTVNGCWWASAIRRGEGAALYEVDKSVMVFTQCLN